MIKKKITYNLLNKLLWLKKRSTGFAVLTYHDIVPDNETNLFDPMCIPFSDFEKQLKIFNTVFRAGLIRRPLPFDRGSELYNNNLKIQELSSTIMIKDKINRFKNWHCYAGIDTIHVNHRGEIFSGGDCPIGMNSNLHDSDYNFPSNTVICPIDMCCCNDDIETRKRKYE